MRSGTGEAHEGGSYLSGGGVDLRDEAVEPSAALCGRKTRRASAGGPGCVPLSGCGNQDAVGAGSENWRDLVRFVAGVALTCLIAGPAFAGFAVDLPIVAGVQGVSTRFYTAVDITNTSAVATDVAFEYISSDYTIDAAGTLLTGLAGGSSFHTEDIIATLASHGFLTSNQAKNTKGTMLLTFLSPAFTAGTEATVTVRTYNFLTSGKTPSVGFSYTGFTLRRRGPHSLDTIASDTTTAGGGVPVVVSNLGIEDVGINDQGLVDTNPVTVQLAFTDAHTGAPIGPQPTINLKSGQVTQINDLWTTYGLPHTTTSVIVTATETAGTAQIRGYVSVKDVSTNDGSVYFMR